MAIDNGWPRLAHSVLKTNAEAFFQSTAFKHVVGIAALDKAFAASDESSACMLTTERGGGLQCKPTAQTRQYSASLSRFVLLCNPPDEATRLGAHVTAVTGGGQTERGTTRPYRLIVAFGADQTRQEQVTLFSSDAAALGSDAMQRLTTTCMLLLISGSPPDARGRVEYVVRSLLAPYAVMSGLGTTADTLYEWWNADLMAQACATLTGEWEAAKARVAREAVPQVEACSRGGRRRTKPTEAEKLVRKKAERLKRLRLLAAQMDDAVEASELRVDTNGAPKPDGVQRFHFKGKMRCVKVQYARLCKLGAEIGRRYPRNVPHVWREGDDWNGEADRLLAVTAQGMPRDVRTFCLPFLHDIDLKACHPSILASKARLFGVAVPELDRYVAHTDDCRQQVMELHAVSKDHAKTLFTLLLYGGSYEYRLKKWERTGAQAEPIKYVQRLEKELRSLREAVMARTELKQQVDSLMAYERTRKSNFGDRLKTEEEAKRSVWSQITQGWEDTALGCIQEAVEAEGLTVHSLMFDGLMVYHDPAVNLKAAMDAASVRIKEQTGMELALEEKPLYDAARVKALK